LPFYSFEWLVGYKEDPNEYLEEISQLYFIVKPVPFQGKIFYFVEMRRQFNQRGGFYYGTFRIIEKIGKNYSVVVRQEDILPDIKAIDEVLKSRRHDPQRMAWAPDLKMRNLKIADDYMLFSLPYTFDYPSGAREEYNIIWVDWRFDGKTLKALKMTVEPYLVYDKLDQPHPQKAQIYIIK